MDYLTQKVSAVAKIIIADLRDIANKISVLRESLEQDGNPIRTAYENEEQQKHELPVALEVKLEKDQEGKRKTESDRQHATQNSIRKATWAAFCAAILYAGIASLQWREAHKTTVIANRAWIGVDRPVAVNSVTVDTHHGGKLSYVVTVKNFGSSVALNIGIWSEAVSAYDKLKPAGEESCLQATTLSRLYRAKIVNRSNFDWPKQFSTGVMFPAEAVGRDFTDLIIQTGQSPSPLIIVGCIVYRDQFDKERQTRFCYGGSGELEKAAVPTLLYQCPVGDNDAN